MLEKCKLPALPTNQRPHTPNISGIEPGTLPLYGLFHDKYDIPLQIIMTISENSAKRKN